MAKKKIKKVSEKKGFPTFEKKYVVPITYQEAMGINHEPTLAQIIAFHKKSRK